MAGVRITARQREIGHQEETVWRKNRNVVCGHKSGAVWIPQKLKVTRMDSPLQPSERVWLYQHLDFGFLGSRTAREYSSVVLSHQLCGDLLWQPQEINTEVYLMLTGFSCFLKEGRNPEFFMCKISFLNVVDFLNVQVLSHPNKTHLHVNSGTSLPSFC